MRGARGGGREARRDAGVLPDAGAVPVPGLSACHLVDDGCDGQVLLEGEEKVGHRLCLDALRGIDEEESPLARGDRAADLIAEVDVPGRVDQVEQVRLAAGGVAMQQRDGLRLDRDAAAALHLERVEHLRLLLALRHGACQRHQPIRQRRLAVVDVRNDTKVADVRRWYVVSLAQPGILHRRQRGAARFAAVTAAAAVAAPVPVASAVAGADAVTAAAAARSAPAGRANRRGIDASESCKRMR